MRGVSSILGAVILAAIVFTVLIPLLIFLQNTTTLYHLQVLERNRAEIERFQENLEIHATISPDNHNIYLLVRNKGSLAANLTSVYIADSGGGLTIWNSTRTISPLSSITPIDLTVKAEEDKAYTIHVATERGRSYAAVEKPLNITDPPYILQVSVINMMFDRKYRIKVTVVEMKTTNGTSKVGCVSAENPCSAEASYEYYSSRWNDNQTFTFRVMPGNYSIQLTEYKFDEGSGSWISTYRGYQQTLMVLKSSVVVFAYEHIPATSIDLNSQFNMTLAAPAVLMVTDEATFDAYVVVRLDDTAKESMRDANVSLIIKPINCSAMIEGRSSYNLEMIKPGQTISLHFRIRVSDVDPSFGGVVYIKGNLTSAVGDRTGTPYNYNTSRTPVSICKLSELPVIKRIALVLNCDECADRCKPYSVIDCIEFRFEPLRGYLCVCGDRIGGVVPRCGQP